MVQNKKMEGNFALLPAVPAVRQVFLTCEQLKLHLAGV